MGLYKSLSGQLRLELTSAQPTVFIQKMGELRIPIYDLSYGGELTLRFTADFRNYRKICAVSQKQGDRLAILSRYGSFFSLQRLIKRPVLLAGILFLLATSLYIPSHIFFYRVEGNNLLPDRLILEKAKACGLHFGASRRLVRSEKLKNALLCELPELQWAGINTQGCVAVISVKERTEEMQSQKAEPVTAIVADRDAVIRSCTVLQGTPMCTVGQSVAKGDILISGITDCGRVTLQKTPDGEVIGDTCREITLIFPKSRLQILSSKPGGQKIDLIVGKKRVNLWESRGLSRGTCGKIVKNCPLILFGKFELPISLEISREIIYETQEISVDAADLSKDAEQYIQSQMIAGQIRSTQFSVADTASSAILQGRCFCTEMIGRLHSEEMIDK